MEHKREKMVDALQDCPVIAALKSDAGLEKAVRSDCTTVFFLYGTILDIASHVERVKQTGKIVFVHADLIEGLTARDITADFIAQNTQADGIISTRPNIIRRAKALGLLTIQRFFLFDSLSFENVLRQSSNADAVDLLPGTMPRVLERLKPPADHRERSARGQAGRRRGALRRRAGGLDHKARAVGDLNTVAKLTLCRQYVF